MKVLLCYEVSCDKKKYCFENKVFKVFFFGNTTNLYREVNRTVTSQVKNETMLFELKLLGKQSRARKKEKSYAASKFGLSNSHT